MHVKFEHIKLFVFFSSIKQSLKCSLFFYRAEPCPAIWSLLHLCLCEKEVCEGWSMKHAAVGTLKNL